MRNRWLPVSLPVLIFFWLFSLPTLAAGVIIPPPSSCIFSGNFLQLKSLRGLAAPIESRGVFFYHCGHGVIWKTLAPVSESLVFKNNGQSYRVEEGHVIPLSSRHNELLGELINGLIGGDQAYIDEYFDVSKTVDLEAPHDSRNKFLLQPSKRRIKRALQSIELLLPADDQLGMSGEVRISMLDRNQQWTHITSTKLAEFAKVVAAPEPCRTLAAITADECKLLRAETPQ